MPPPGIIEAINVAAKGQFGIRPCQESCPPDQIGFDSFEYGFHHGVVVAVPLYWYLHLQALTGR